jgi:uncharacterized alpha-E superfamily protein
MLSRHAEDLFWAGRYIERADDTARLLDVTYHGLLESPLADAATSWRELLEVLSLEHAFAERHAAVTGAAVSAFLVLDGANPGAITSAVSRARENARNVRERISTELWEAINTFHLELRGRDLREDLERQPYQIYSLVKSRCQTIAGAASETMSRDDGWRFLLLGRMLERAEMICRLLSVRFGSHASTGLHADVHYWMAVLKSVSAFEAYVKLNRAEIDRTDVLELLLLSREFPRSVLFCLRASERELASLGAGMQPSRPERLLGRLRADLEFADVHELLEAGLLESLETVQGGIRGVADAVAAHFFLGGASPALHAFEAA